LARQTYFFQLAIRWDLQVPKIFRESTGIILDKKLRFLN